MLKINIMQIPSTYLNFKNVPFSIEDVGHIELEAFDRDECWHLCNWSCWTNEKPDNLFSNIGVANSDVIFHDTASDEFHLALPLGWHVEKSLQEILKYIGKISPILDVNKPNENLTTV